MFGFSIKSFSTQLYKVNLLSLRLVDIKSEQSIQLMKIMVNVSEEELPQAILIE